MTNFLIKLFDVSLSACSIIVVVLLLRLLMKKAPAYIRCLLWALVGIRLLMPISVESNLSLVPSSTPVSSFIEERAEKDEIPPPAVNGAEDTAPTPPVVQDPQVVPDAPVTPDANESLPITQSPADDTEKDGIAWQKVLFYVWVVGAVAMLAYIGISYARMRYKVKDALVYDEEVRIYNGNTSPFVLGLLRPKIYLPGGFTDEQLACIISHEKAHISRLDYIFKPLAYCILSLHWFNPLVWLSYVLFCKDTELACDEKVISTMDAKGRKLYSVTLLACSANRFGLTSPLAFGETAIKERVTKIMKYKKPSFWIILTAVVICIAVAVFFITNPKENSTDDVSTEQSAEQSFEQSAEESLEQSAVNSEDGSSVDESSALSSADESVDESADESVDVSADVSVDVSTDESEDVSTDTSTEPDNGENATPVVRLPYQKTHETPESISNIENNQLTYHRRNIHPAYVTVWNKSHEKSSDALLKKKGLKIWLCDADGNKIDYVYTNSHGIARFEIDVKGTYSICFDGNDTYSACAPEVSFYIVNDYYLATYGAMVPNKVLYVYDKTLYKPFTIKTYDAITKEPLANVNVYTHKDKSKLFATTGSNGSVTLNPIISYTSKEASSIAFRFYLEKEGYDGYSVSRVGPEEALLEVYLFPYMDQPYKITIINQKTREPIEGVVLNNSPTSDPNGPIIKVSGSDGVVSGIKTDEQLKTSTYVILYYEAVVVTEYGDSVTRSTELVIAINKGQTEYNAYFIQTDTGKFMLSAVDSPSGYLQ